MAKPPRVMTDPLAAERDPRVRHSAIRALIEQVVDEIEAVPVVEYCECSRPRAEHTFWDDKIYDVQGRKCPGTDRSWNGEYRFSASLTAVRHRDARIAKVDTLLEAALSVSEASHRALLVALEELVINANRLCDRQLGGTYEDDCRRSIKQARAAIAIAEGR